MEDRKVNAVVPSKVKKDDLMAFVNYVKVKETNSNGEELIVTNLHNGRDIKIAGKDLIVSSLSADQFEETVKVSMTEAARILISAYNRPFTVAFQKKDKSERILRGRFIKHEDLMGRSVVEDLDTKDANKVRQVDHREIKFIILEGVKFVVK